MRTGFAADNYTYAETNYANPHAPGAYFNGTATTTYSYDAIGNLATTTGAATSTFVWDYKNRMLRAWVSGATSTYQYDHTIARMAQMTPTTTSHYPNKFYSVEYAGSSTTTGTSTAFIFQGDTLVAYIEQRIANGVATGTPTTYLVHPDHLGSTNVVTNSSGTVVEALAYYPYGAERIHSGSADLDRTFIGQFADDATSLDYLNARYYDPARGQFLSQDPAFLAIGDPRRVSELLKQDQQTFLADPQQMQSYGYGRDNPITQKDPSGNGIVADRLVVDLFRYTSTASDLASSYDHLQDLRAIFGNPTISTTQHIGTAIDVGAPLVLMAPSLAPAAVPLTLWDVFVRAGEMISGRPASDAPQYVEDLKDKLRREQFVPGYQFKKASNAASGPASTQNRGGATSITPSQTGGATAQQRSAQISQLQARYNALKSQFDKLKSQSR